MMDVGAAVRVLVEERGDAMAVVTMSAIPYWGEPRADDLRLMGLMGGAASIGLGLAIGAPERDVWVVDGDGSLLMQLGVLSAISDAQPGNLTHIVVDNGIYAISGAQPTPGRIDWPTLMLGAGIADVVVSRTETELRAAVTRDAAGPRAIVARCERRRPDYPPGGFEVRPADEAARVRRTLASHPLETSG